MSDIDYYHIMKWVLIVLAAGFIGQFGKSLATYLIQRARRTKTPSPSEGATGFVKEPTETMLPPIPERKEPQIKADKKASKALLKLTKKGNK